jgi:manganese/zinc/iron transport system permease protein
VSESAFDILLTGSLAAAACAIPGTFLILRRMSLLGDAISHAVLPGIVIAVLLTGELTSWPVVIGAGALGLVTVFLIEAIRGSGRVKEDAAIAIVFPALFALGVLLIAQYAGQKHIDQDCVLYGEIAYAHLDTMTVFGGEVPRAPFVLGIVTLLNILFVTLLYKELKIATFDGAMAATIGISPVVVHYALMASVSMTTVASFETVGAILVVAFLIVPGAAAHLWTDRLWVLLILAVGIGVVSAAGGFWLATAIGASISGCMAAAMGVAFLLSWLFAPREGVLGRALALRRSRRRFASALVLERLDRAPATRDALVADLRWPRERLEQALFFLEREGLIDHTPKGLRPSPEGLRFIRAVVE